MKQKNFLKIGILLFFSILMSPALKAQIYSADFSNDGDGFADHTSGNPPATAPASVGPFGSIGNQWFLSYTSTPNSDGSSNSFKVDGGALVSDDWGGQGIFESQSINVSAFNSIDITAITVNSGANDNNFKYFYILDGGSRVETSNITSSNGDNLNYTITVDVTGITNIVVGFEFDENGGGDGYTTSSFTVAETPAATPGITLSAVSGNTNEDGTTATLTVVLNTQPATNVVLNTVSGDTDEVTIAPAILTFTNTNWNIPQTITATGVDDAIQDGSTDTTITIAVDDVNSDDTYDAIADVTTTITNEDNELPSLIINELLSDDGTLDANGDGETTNTDDEFIEIYNTTASDIDISGFTVEDAVQTRHTFPSGTIIPANQTIVVFGGGKISGISGLTQIASTGLLGLNNGGDTITIKDALGIIVSSVTYGSDANDDQSIARSPDFTGSFVKHTTLSGGLTFSPGKNNTDGVTPFTPLITWNGNTNSNWNDDTNWAGGTKPSNNNDVLIPDVSTLPELTTTANIINLTIATNAGLNVNAGGKLTLLGNILLNTSTDITVTSTISGTNTLNAGTIILKGCYNALDASGQFFYFTETNMNNTDDWSLIASPVIDEGIQKFANFVGLRTNNNNIAIAPYNNNGRAWDYYKTSATVPADAEETLLSAAGNFVTAKGYTISPNSLSGSISPSAKGNIGFQGDFPTDEYTYAINVGSSNAFNLTGNPYPSFIPLNDNADGTHNILRVNGANGLDILSEDTVWIWDKEANSGNGDYVTINLAAASRFIAPAQSFFVSAKSGGGNFSYTKNMQNHQTSGIFSKTTNDFKIKIIMEDDTRSKTTDIFYLDDKTIEFDNGYDSSIFSGVSNTFAVYTEILSEGEEKNLSIQTLPNSNYENMIIPVGVISKANKEVVFSAEIVNTPPKLEVFLEDRALGIFTHLKNNATYTVTLNQSLNGTGRFYVHTTQSVLSIDNDAILNSIAIFPTKDSALKITGLKSGKTAISMYNILGKQVLSTSFNANSTNTIDLPELTTGIYMVNLQTNEGKITKKIILE